VKADANVEEPDVKHEINLLVQYVCFKLLEKEDLAILNNLFIIAKQILYYKL
jgi:hypothetical protein